MPWLVNTGLFPRKLRNKVLFTAFHSSEKRLDHQLVLLYLHCLCELSSERYKALHDEDDC